MFQKICYGNHFTLLCSIVEEIHFSSEISVQVLNNCIACKFKQLSLNFVVHYVDLTVTEVNVKENH